MMIYLHCAIAAAFFVIGFCMRFGLWKGLARFAYEHVARLRKNEYDEFDTRVFVGETAIKLGVIIFFIAMIGIFRAEDFKIAMAVGWFCAIFYAVASVTFIDKVDIFEKRRREKRRTKMEKTRQVYESWNEGAADADSSASEPSDNAG